MEGLCYLKLEVFATLTCVAKSMTSSPAIGVCSTIILFAPADRCLKNDESLCCILFCSKRLSVLLWVSSLSTYDSIAYNSGFSCSSAVSYTVGISGLIDIRGVDACFAIECGRVGVEVVGVIGLLKWLLRSASILSLVVGEMLSGTL